MPKFTCRKCHHEFWGWGIYHEHMSGKRVECPDCKGTLVLQKEETKAPGKKVIKAFTAA